VCTPQIVDENRAQFCGSLTLCAKHGGRMVSSQDLRAQLMQQMLSSGGINGKRSTGQGAQRGSSERDNDLWLNRSDFLIQPNIACFDFTDSGLFVQPPLAARFPLEMLHRVRDVNVAASEPGCLQGLIEHPPCGPDERMTAQVFFVAWLFSDQHDSGPVGPFAHHSLGSVLPQIAPSAILRAFA
jgi:hypothetical protein